MIKPTVHINHDAIKHVKAEAHKRSEEAKHVINHRASVGIHEAEGSVNKVEYDGKTSGATLTEVGLAHEFGIRVPERSWLRTWVDSNKPRLQREMFEVARRAYKGDSSAFETQANKWAGELRAWIGEGAGGLPSLAPATILQKQQYGLSKPETPLYATGQLVEAIKAMLDD